MGIPKILVIEDDRDNLGLVRFILERASYAVIEAYDGRQGVEVARRELPDLILLDLAMPEMDGWEAARELKTDPLTLQIPIIALTVRSLPEDRKRAMDAGVDGYITKPMSVSYFVSEVANYISRIQHDEVGQASGIS